MAWDDVRNDTLDGSGWHGMARDDTVWRAGWRGMTRRMARDDAHGWRGMARDEQASVTVMW